MSFRLLICFTRTRGSIARTRTSELVWWWQIFPSISLILFGKMDHILHRPSLGPAFKGTFKLPQLKNYISHFISFSFRHHSTLIWKNCSKQTHQQKPNERQREVWGEVWWEKENKFPSGQMTWWSNYRGNEMRTLSVTQPGLTRTGKGIYIIYVYIHIIYYKII